MYIGERRRIGSSWPGCLYGLLIEILFSLLVRQSYQIIASIPDNRAFLHFPFFFCVTECCHCLNLAQYFIRNWLEILFGSVKKFPFGGESSAPTFFQKISYLLFFKNVEKQISAARSRCWSIRKALKWKSRVLQVRPGCTVFSVSS